MDFTLLILIIVLFVQLYSFRKTFLIITKLSDLFPSSENLEIGKINLESYSYDEVIIKNNMSEEFKSILKNTNKFLAENKGTAADFNMLKDISERESDKIERSIISTISVPIYLGLIGTITGIFISLFFLEFPIGDKSFERLISGASIAMAASGMGILLTLLNSSVFFKKAKMVSDNYRNDYYTFLQVKLMPSLNNDMNSSLKNIKVVLEKFNEEFSLKFEKNISTFKDSISIISQNLEQQKDFLNLLNKSRLNDIIKTNSTLLDKIETSSNQLFSTINNTFTDMLSEIKSTENYFVKLGGILRETVNSMNIMNTTSQKMNDVFNEAIGSKDKLQTVFLQAGDNLENSNRLIQFLKDYYEDIENLKSGSEKSYNSLNEHLSNMSNEFLKTLGVIENNNFEQMNNHYEGFKNHVNNTTTENSNEVKLIIENYKKWLDDNQLDKLFKEMKNELVSINQNLEKHNLSTTSEKISSNLESIIENDKTVNESSETKNSEINNPNENKRDEHKPKGFFSNFFGQ